MVEVVGQAGADLGVICVNRDQLKRSIIREIQDAFPIRFRRLGPRFRMGKLG
jgi:hypothetical protein